MNTIPTIQQIKALDGRVFATLTATESEVLDFYRAQGRKYDVIITIVNKADPDDLATAKSQQQADHILKSANSLIAVTVGAAAVTAWTTRDERACH